MKQKKKRKYAEIEYWKPFADVLSAILLTILLFTIVLLLHYNNEREYKDEAERISVHHETTMPQPTTRIVETTTHHENSDGGEETTTEEVETGEREEGKTAVKVHVIDKETKKLIKKKNIEFALYTSQGVRVKLNTYYPEKKSYNVFKTDKNGTFYLPEKIQPGAYYFKQLSDINGYDRNEKASFEVLEIYDWHEAYVVKIKVGPAQNNLRIVQLDSDDGTTVKNGKYQIIAADDIQTLDGTLRYSAGQVIDTIEINDKGIGESKMAYLGKFQMRQMESPNGYAVLSKTIEFTLKHRKEVGLTIVKEVPIQKTRCTVQVSDEYDNSIGISNAKFILQNDKGQEERTIETNEFGQFVLEDLYKNTTYKLIQQTSKEGYLFSKEAYTFKVDKNGRIENQNNYLLTITNKILRMNVNLYDRLFKFRLSNYMITFKDSTGRIVASWDSSETGYQVSGISPGNYTLDVSGINGEQINITIEDKAELQTHNIKIFTILDMVVVILAGCIVIAVIIILIKFRKRIFKKRKSKSKE